MSQFGHFKENLCSQGKRKVVRLQHPVVATDGEVTLEVILDISTSMNETVTSEKKEASSILKPILDTSHVSPSMSRLISAPSDVHFGHRASLTRKREIVQLPPLREEDSDEDSNIATGGSSHFLQPTLAPTSIPSLERQVSVDSSLSVVHSAPPLGYFSSTYENIESYIETNELSKMDVAIESLCRIVDYIVDSKKRVCLTVHIFNEKITTFIDSVLVDSDSHEDVKKNIQSIKPHGATNILAVRDKIVEIMESCDDQTNVLVISDGFHTSNGTDGYTRDKIKKDRDILVTDFTTVGSIFETKSSQIFSTGIGVPGRSENIYNRGTFDAELLEAMGGTFSSGNTVETITNGIIGPCFNAISKIATNFKLCVKSPKVISIFEFEKNEEYQVLTLPDVDYTQQIIFFVDSDEDELEIKLTYFSEVDKIFVEKEGLFRFTDDPVESFFDENVLLCRILQKYRYGLKMKGDGKDGSLKKCLQVQVDIFDSCSRDIASLELSKDHPLYFLKESYQKMIMRTKERFVGILLRQKFSYSDSVIVRSHLREASSGRPADLSRLVSDVL